MADEVIGLLADPTPDTAAVRTVGCYVNTVGMAVEVAHALRTRHSDGGRAPNVVMVCGQVRPADLKRLPDNVLSLTGNPAVDVLLTTQSLEVGVDLDLAAVVTELAPGSALVQRAGRANRRGLRPAAPVHVIVPQGKLTDGSRSGPYQPDDLAAEPQLDLWLAENFDEDITVGLAVRDVMPADAVEAVSLVRAIPPRADEVFTVPRATAVSVVTQALRLTGATDEAEPPQAVRRRGDEITVVDPKKVDIRPGDLVVIDSRTAAFTPSTTAAGDGFSPPAPITADPDSADAVPANTVADLLHALPAPVPGQVVVRLEPGVWPGMHSVARLLKQYAELSEDATEKSRRVAFGRLLNGFTADLGDHPAAAMLQAALRLLRGPARDSEIILDRDGQGEPVWLILLDKRRAWFDEQVRQTWLPRQEPVLLDDHQTAVADRAAWIGGHVQLPPPLVETLRLAGRHHDDGKADPRFQKGLGANGQPPAEFRESARQAGLPERWRHEQMSVVACWDTLHAALPPEHARLAARLVGTSHGHGRHGFPHSAAELLTPDTPAADHRLAEDLFDLGDWDSLIEATHHRWGIWGCAYLEALLRAADGQVSGEDK